MEGACSGCASSSSKKGLNNNNTRHSLYPAEQDGQRGMKSESSNHISITPTAANLANITGEGEENVTESRLVENNGDISLAEELNVSRSIPVVAGSSRLGHVQRFDFSTRTYRCDISTSDPPVNGFVAQPLDLEHHSTIGRGATGDNSFGSRFTGAVPKTSVTSRELINGSPTSFISVPSISNGESNGIEMCFKLRDDLRLQGFNRGEEGDVCSTHSAEASMVTRLKRVDETTMNGHGGNEKEKCGQLEVINSAVEGVGCRGDVEVEQRGAACLEASPRPSAAEESSKRKRDDKEDWGFEAAVLPPHLRDHEEEEEDIPEEREDDPDRCSPDSGEGEFEPHESVSPSWADQNSESSSEGEESCFYRYRGEDDAQGPGPALNIAVAAAQEERRASSPEMDYLEMDFDPSSSDCWGGEDPRPPPPPSAVLPQESSPPTPPPLPQAQEEIEAIPEVAQEVIIPVATSSSRNTRVPEVPREIHHSQTRRVREEVPEAQRGDILLWSQTRASELTHPFSTPLTSATNAMFYTLTALGLNISRETITAYLNESYPSLPPPPSVVGYLAYRGLSTPPQGSLSPYAPPTPILRGPDLVHTLSVVTGGQVAAWFFPLASRDLLESGQLCTAITTWLDRGIVPILSFSRAASEGERHEMVFGSTEAGILTMGEPYRALSETALGLRLAAQGRITISFAHVRSRWDMEGGDRDLRPLVLSEHPNCLAWMQDNLLGSLVGLLRDSAVATSTLSPSPPSSSSSRQHYPQPMLTLPLRCESGVTLACLRNNPHISLLEAGHSFIP